MWTRREKKAPSRLSPALITANLQIHSHQKYHPGIFLFTSCRSCSVTFNLCKYLPFENLAFPHLSLHKSPLLFYCSYCTAASVSLFLASPPQGVLPPRSPFHFTVFSSQNPPVVGISAYSDQQQPWKARAVTDTLLAVCTATAKPTRIHLAERFSCH